MYTTERNGQPFPDSEKRAAALGKRVALGKMKDQSKLEYAFRWQEENLSSIHSSWEEVVLGPWREGWPGTRLLSWV